MLKYIFLLVTSIATIHVVAQPLSYTHNEKEQLLGKIKIEDLQKEPYADWYDQVYHSYTLDEKTLDLLNEHYDDNVSIEVYLGTWCGDSKRNVTRFLKIVDSTMISPDNITLLCLDNREGKYKQGPNREEATKKIHRVPTFIFYKDNEEIGRIVERPVNTLEQDITMIYAGMPTMPNYIVANYLLAELEKCIELTTIDSTFQKHVRYFKSLSTSASELNTVGYVLLAAGKLKEALQVFLCNTYLYPEDGNTWDSLAEGYLKNGDLASAIKNYMVAYQLDPSNEGAITAVQNMVTSQQHKQMPDPNLNCSTS